MFNTPRRRRRRRRLCKTAGAASRRGTITACARASLVPRRRPRPSSAAVLGSWRRPAGRRAVRGVRRGGGSVRGLSGFGVPRAGCGVLRPPEPRAGGPVPVPSPRPGPPPRRLNPPPGPPPCRLARRRPVRVRPWPAAAAAVRPVPPCSAVIEPRHEAAPADMHAAPASVASLVC